jgi:hypothetical protein
VDAWLDDPVVGPTDKPINFVGFGVGNGFPACIPRAGMRVDWCVNLVNVGFFRYPNVRACWAEGGFVCSPPRGLFWAPVKWEEGWIR